MMEATAYCVRTAKSMPPQGITSKQIQKTMHGVLKNTDKHISELTKNEAQYQPFLDAMSKRVC
eukprot:m.238120 g.238120  ORF g.238120 m.238120 type:complete len:63 (-) comp26563_c0_seq4:2244-2432(-)